MKKELEKLIKDVKICGIYKITSPTDRVYIGQSNDLIRRKKDYEKYIKNSNREDTRPNWSLR